MDFPKALRQCQREKHMTNEAFARSLGKSRTWLQWIYATNSNVSKHTLSDMTMYSLNEKLGIPIEIMEEYNKQIRESVDNRWVD